MTPETRYARTSDGVSIAYFAIGNGPVLIDLVSPPLANVDLIWRIGEFWPQMEAASRRVTYVQFDPRGFGMSDRDVSEFSLGAMVRDLEAVADALGPDPFAIAAWSERSMVALAYAASHQDRVIALALREGFASGAFKPRRGDAGMIELARNNWDLFTRASADRTQNILSVTGLRQMHELITRSASQETFVRYIEAWVTWDVFDLLPSVTAPVLVTNDGGNPIEASRRLVAALHNGSLVSNAPPRGERSPSQDAFTAFLAHAFATARAADVDGETPPDPEAARRAGLTPREVEVLRRVVAGQSGREIAAVLVLSPRTVERHIANIYRKTDTHGRAQLAGFALRHRLV